MRTVDPNESYDRKRFVNAVKDLGKLEVALQGISTADGNWNPDLRDDLGDLIGIGRNKEVRRKFYAGAAPDHVLNESNKAHSEYTDNIAFYSKDKWEFLLDKINSDHNDQLVSLVSMLPLAWTEDKTDKDYNQLKWATDEKRRIAKAEQNGRQGLEAYVSDKMKKAEAWRQESYYGYSSGDPTYLTRMFNAYKADADATFNHAVLNKEGKEIDRDKLMRILKKSYNLVVKNEANRAKEQYDKIKNDEGKEKDKADYLKVSKDGAESDLAKAYRVAIAKAAYESVRKEED